jgi:hypothetical protein
MLSILGKKPAIAKGTMIPINLYSFPILVKVVLDF